MNDYLQSLNITHSFSRAHVPYDNSVMEPFFSSMKREELYRTKYRSESDSRKGVDKYIIFYNTKRPHRKDSRTEGRRIHLEIVGLRDTCEWTDGFEKVCFQTFGLPNLRFSVFSPNDKKNMRPQKAA